VRERPRRLACPIEWHGGFTLTTTELRRHPGYRGQQFVDLGASLARNGRLDPRILGDASRTGRHDEQASNASGITWQDSAAPRRTPDPFLTRFTHAPAETTSMDLNAYQGAWPATDHTRTQTPACRTFCTSRIAKPRSNS
jgi:hypothetical protein